MDHRERRINLRAAAWVQEIHRAAFHHDPKRQAKLHAWLDRSNTNRVAFQHALHAWAQLKHIDPANKLVSSSLNARLALRRRTQPESRARWWAVAAVVVLSVLGMPMLANRLTASATFIGTEAGESRTITLEDGTVVHLNSATRIALETHGRVREVHLLKGDAFFSVAPGAGRSFRVFAPFAIAASDRAQFDVSRHSNDMAIVTVKGVAAIVAIDPYTHTATVLGNSSRLAEEAMVVRPGDVVRIEYGEGMRIRRDTVSHTQLEQVLTGRQGPPSLGKERSEAVTETFKPSNAKKMVIADSVIAAQSVSGHVLATDPVSYANARQRELTGRTIESDFDADQRAWSLCGTELPASVVPPNLLLCDLFTALFGELRLPGGPSLRAPEDRSDYPTRQINVAEGRHQDRGEADLVW
jgi:transmembrane sensor